MNCPTASAPAAAVPSFKKSRRDTLVFSIVPFSHNCRQPVHENRSRLESFAFFAAVQSCPVDQIEQEYAHQSKEQHGQVGIEVPDIGHDDIAIVGDFRYHWENLLVSHTINHSADQETEQTRDDIIELAFAAPGGAGARSEPGEGHAHTKYQPSNQVPDDVGGRHAGEGNPAKPPKSI